MSDAAERRISEDRRAQVAQLEAAEAQLEAIRDARGAATADDEHDPEGGTLAAEWSRAEGRRADALRELERLDAAQARVEAGTYGTCVSCGRSIPAARMRVVPSATMCVECAAATRG